VARLCTLAIEPELGSKTLGETTRDDWVRIIRVVRERAPATATWLYTTAASFLNYAETAGWITASPMPRKGLATIAPRGKARERILTDAELIAIWNAAATFNPKPRLFVRLLAMTALRETEAADLMVGEVDLENGTATLPAERTKGGNSAITVPLHPLWIADLRRVWPEDDPDPAFKLLGARPNGSTGFRGFSGLKLRLDAASETSGWRWHDLRRTARSGMARLGVQPLHAELALNHLTGRSTIERIYDRYSYREEVLAALRVWQGYLAGLVGWEASPASGEAASHGLHLVTG
jgi:integrase